MKPILGLRLNRLSSMTETSNCPLCNEPGGALLYRNGFLRVIDAGEPHYPAFTRVILNRHVQEMTDLTSAERRALMGAVYLVEALQRRHFQPHKINVAQLGNMVPHVHWHIIPRFRDDRHFPNPVWGAARVLSSETDSEAAQACADRVALVKRHLPAYQQDLTDTFTTVFGDPEATLPDDAELEQTLLRIADL